MHALLLDGTQEDDGGTRIVRQVLTSELESAGFEPERVVACELEVAPCRGCFACWERNPGECLTDDEARNVARKYMRTDLAVFFTPVTFGGYSSSLKMVLDRMLPNISPFFMDIGGETHHVPRYDRYPPFLAVGVCPDPDEETRDVFTTLAGRNAINMYSPNHHAAVVTPDDDRLQAYIRQMIRFTRGNR